MFSHQHSEVANNCKHLLYLLLLFTVLYKSLLVRHWHFKKILAKPQSGLTDIVGNLAKQGFNVADETMKRGVDMAKTGMNTASETIRKIGNTFAGRLN